MVIENGPPGNVVRADINGALQALASKNSGPGEPSTKYDYMDWPDTNTGYLKQYNPAENAFHPVRVLDSRILTSAASGGTTYSVTFAPAISAFLAGLQYLFRADAANTGVCTFNANGIGAVAIKKLLDGSYVDLAAGDIPADHLCFMIYSGTLGAMVLINPNQAAVVTAARTGFTNLVATVTGNTTMTITADEVTLKNASGQYVTKTGVNLTSLNTGNSGANGLDMGSIQANMSYFHFVIYNGITVAGLLSLSSTAPTLPSGYTYYARSGAVITDASGNLLRTTQAGNKVFYNLGINPTQYPIVASGIQGSFGPSSWTPVAASVNGIVPSTAKLIIMILRFTTGGNVSAIAPNTNYSGMYSVNPPFYSYGSSGNIPINLMLETRDIYYSGDGSGNQAQCMGWEDNL